MGAEGGKGCVGVLEMGVKAPARRWNCCCETQRTHRSLMNVQTKQRRIAELARRMPTESFKSLNHYIDLPWLHEAYRRTRKDASAGVDGVSTAEYEGNLEENLQSLLNRLKSGTYYTPAVRRVYIPKDERGKDLRPIGIPTLEDKVLQRAIGMVMEPIFEQDFMDCSYGFRPRRSVHQAIEALWHATRNFGGCWVLEVDVRKYFDTIKHEHLRTFYKQRVCDGVITRVLGKWLKAGVMEDGAIHYPEDGTPQGGVISPLLSNIYLHVVLDKWFEEEIKPRLNCKAQLIRFADDFVMVFETKEDAERVRRVIVKRFERYGLTIHSEKMRLVDYANTGDKSAGTNTFDFLGFTHYWGKSRYGKWIPKRKTAKDRLKRSIRKVHIWCKTNRHQTVSEQWKVLSRKVQGHYNFFGVTYNSKSLGMFYEQIKRSWRKWLDRRNRNRQMNWEKFNCLLERYPLPKPSIVHTYVA
jgi:RNA-directed DNA polymerase